MLQIALSEGLHIWKDIKPSRNTNKNSLKPKEECNCNYFGWAHPMLNPPRRLPKTTTMSPSPGAHGGAREEAEHAKKRCPAVAAAEKINGLCVVFSQATPAHRPPSRSPPDSSKHSRLARCFPTRINFAKKKKRAQGKISFLSPKQAIISCKTM